MFVKELENGKYRFYQKYYDDFNKVWKQVTTTLPTNNRVSRSKAEKILSEKIEKALNKRSLTNDKLRVNDVKDEWLAIRREELKESTYTTQQRMFDIFFKNTADCYLTDLQPHHIQKVLMEKSWSTGYRSQVKNVISLFFEYCLRSGYIKENPCKKMVLPKKRKTLEEIQARKNKYLDSKQMKRFIAYIGGATTNFVFSAVIEIMYLTGLRSGEAFALTWEDIDFENRLIKVGKTLHYRKGGTWYVTSPKTLNAYRDVYFSERVLILLMDLRKAGGSNGFVFEFNGRPLKLVSVNNYLKRNFERCGIDKGQGFELTSHVLRHSHISLLAELGIPIKVIMERVGHGDEKTTLEIYTHVTEQMTYDLRQKLELIS